MKRQSNRPDRRFVKAAFMSPADRQTLASRLRYAGSALHKRMPGNYGFHPPVNPRASKSLCDDVRSIDIQEATALLQSGINAGMFSQPDAAGIPKYIWAVDDHDEVYEAKTRPPDTDYHGYRLGNDDPDQRHYILEEWRLRCP